MTDPIAPRSIPLDQIDADALPRDRRVDDPEAKNELMLSILRDGQRQPIEVYQKSAPAEGEAPFGLISGYRRLAVLRALQTPSATAIVRQPGSVAAALADMVTENEIRAQISPWEKAALIVDCLAENLFETPDAAIDALYPALSRQKRSRLRGHVMVAEGFAGAFATPERLSYARLDRLAAALRAGWQDLLDAALAGSGARTLDAQWDALEPTLTEALSPEGAATAPGTRRAPRRTCRPHENLTIRREHAKNGWVLRFSGPEARSPGLIDDVFEMIEREFGKR